MVSLIVPLKDKKSIPATKKSAKNFISQMYQIFYSPTIIRHQIILEGLISRQIKKFLSLIIKIKSEIETKKPIFGLYDS
jgi:hypothetical protein